MGKRIDIINEMIASLDEAADIMAGKVPVGGGSVMLSPARVIATIAANPAEQRWTPAGLRAWGNALVQTGIEHLDLDMVRQGKRALLEAAMPEPAADVAGDPS